MSSTIYSDRAQLLLHKPFFLFVAGIILVFINISIVVYTLYTGGLL